MTLAHTHTYADGRHDLRDDFPVLRRTVDGIEVNYLDSAATSLKPQSVIDAIVRYYAEVGANIHRGKHMLSEEASHSYEKARVRVAQFIGAQANEVSFTAGTTHALNIVATGLGLTPDDLVLVSADSHHSQQLPWRHHARIEWIPVEKDGQVNLDRYAELLEQRPKVVALTHCSNVTGRYAPVARMAAMAREHGAISVLDAAQSVPHRPVDMHELGVDAMAFSGHKMLGPTGIGVLALSAKMFDTVAPADHGGGMVDWVDTEKAVWRRAPHRFEAGTPHIAGAYGMLAAVDYLERLGMAEVAAHDARMARVLHREAAARDYLTILAPGEGERSGIVSVGVRGCRDLSELARILSDSFGIMCRSGHLCAQPLVDALAGGQVLRISAYVYTTEDDVLRAFEALDNTFPLVGA